MVTTVREFNRGLDDGFFGEEPKSNHPDYMQGYGYGYGYSDPFYGCPNPPVPEASLEEMCAPHSYHGDDVEGGRCYCGQVRYDCRSADGLARALDVEEKEPEP